MINNKQQPSQIIKHEYEEMFISDTESMCSESDRVWMTTIIIDENKPIENVKNIVFTFSKN